MGTFRLMTQLGHLFTQTVTIAPWASQNTFGEASYGSPVSYGCRIEPTTVRTNGENQTLVSAVKVILNQYVQVDPRDRVLLPAGYGSRNDAAAFEAPSSPLIQVKYLDDHVGTICTVLICSTNTMLAR